MLLKWIYYGVALLLAVPLIAWGGIASIIMWDAKYWDNVCHGVYQALDNDDDRYDHTIIDHRDKFITKDGLNPKNRF